MFSGKLLNSDTIFILISAFIAFSLAASAVYIGNDIFDYEKDRQHPVKCHRPIASGQISRSMASFLAVGLIALSVGISYIINVDMLMAILIYIIINVFYSLRLKHIVIIDVMIIAIGFVLRAFVGVIVAGVGATAWFILCVFMLSIFLALAKRRGELILLGEHKEKQRKVLHEYSIDFLNVLIIVVCAIMLTSYSLFSQSATGIELYGLPLMMLTIPIVVYGVFRYLYLIFLHNYGESPEKILIHDKPILFTVIIYVLIVIILRDI